MAAGVPGRVVRDRSAPAVRPRVATIKAKVRDGVIRAFCEMYRTQPGEFPSGVAEAEYRRRMELSYPIHPELFDRLFGEWSTLDKFQRTRGVLRLMALGDLEAVAAWRPVAADHAGQPADRDSGHSSAR